MPRPRLSRRLLLLLPLAALVGLGLYAWSARRGPGGLTPNTPQVLGKTRLWGHDGGRGDVANRE